MYIYMNSYTNKIKVIKLGMRTSRSIPASNLCNIP